MGPKIKLYQRKYSIYSDGVNTIVVAKTPNRMVARRMVKTYGLVV